MTTPTSTGPRPIDTEEINNMAVMIQGRLCGRIRDFHLTKHARGLILKGHAPSYHAKQLAQHAVMETTTEPILANEIEVISSGREVVFV